MKFKNLPEELPVETRVASALSQTQILDIHTHLYDPAMGKMLLWGIDELLTYHYLVAESFRFFKMPYKDFFLLEKKQQAELIWNELFIKHSPISESCRGVITTLNMLGLDVNRRDLNSIRKWFAQRTVEQHVQEVFESANLSAAVMTNSPFDSEESAFWKKGFSRDSRFLSALRVDPLVLEYNSVVGFLRQQGFDVRSDLDQKTRDELMRFLHLWADTIQPLYLMASLPPGYSSALDSEDSSILTQVILPFCKTRGLPFAIMAGVTRSVNPLLGLAGDSLGSFSIESIEKLCRTFPDNKFLVTALSRENQHHL